MAREETEEEKAEMESLQAKFEVLSTDGVKERKKKRKKLKKAKKKLKKHQKKARKAVKTERRRLKEHEEANRPDPAIVVESRLEKTGKLENYPPLILDRKEVKPTEKLPDIIPRTCFGLIPLKYGMYISAILLCLQMFMEILIHPWLGKEPLKMGIVGEPQQDPRAIGPLHAIGANPHESELSGFDTIKLATMSLFNGYAILFCLLVGAILSFRSGWLILGTVLYCVDLAVNGLGYAICVERTGENDEYTTKWSNTEVHGLCFGIYGFRFLTSFLSFINIVSLAIYLTRNAYYQRYKAAWWSKQTTFL